MNNGIFITFEGIDASGKSTQIELLVKHLEAAGINPVMVREPGGTPIGEKIRQVLLDSSNSDMLPLTEALLYAASRAQLVGEIIKPALESGRVVISDRFLDSSIAYQGYGRNLGDIVRVINEPAAGDIVPDITFFLRTEPSSMRDRRSAADEDRMDSQTSDFYSDVLNGYLSLAAENQERFCVIDGQSSITDVFDKIRLSVEELLKKKHARLGR